MDKGSPSTTNTESIKLSLGRDSGGHHEDGNTRVQVSGVQVINPLLPILWGAPAHMVQALPPAGKLSGGHRHNIDMWPIKRNPCSKRLQGSGALFPWLSWPDCGRWEVHWSSGEGGPSCFGHMPIHGHAKEYSLDLITCSCYPLDLSPAVPVALSSPS